MEAMLLGQALPNEFTQFSLQAPEGNIFEGLALDLAEKEQLKRAQLKRTAKALATDVFDSTTLSYFRNKWVLKLLCERGLDYMGTATWVFVGMQLAGRALEYGMSSIAAEERGAKAF